MRTMLLALIALALPPAPAQAQAPTSDQKAAIHDFFRDLEMLTDRLADQADEFSHHAREAIIAGGALVAQNRNTISGGALGCAAGAVVAGSSAVLLSAPSAGASAAVAPDAVAAGCALGALTGAGLGWELDHPRD